MMRIYNFKVFVLITVLASCFYVFHSLSYVAALDPGNFGGGLPTEEEGGGASIPKGCFDTDGSGVLNEQDCGDPANANCVPCGGSTEEDTTEKDTSVPVGNKETDWTGVDLTIQDVFSIITGVACWMIRVVGAVMVIFIILAGLQFMNARDNPTKWTAAKTNFGHVLWGALVILGVYVIIATVANAIGVNISFIPLVC